MGVLIADDNRQNAELLRQLLADAGYQNVSVCHEADAVTNRCTASPQPDLLVLDLHMPGLSGYEVLGQLRQMLTSEPFLPVLIVTADVSQEARRRALSLGASDFITKPVDPTEFLLRTSHLLRTHQLRQALKDMVAVRTAELEQARLQTLQHLLIAAECRDDATGQHTIRVGRTAGLLATTMGLPTLTAAQIAAAAPLHDLGKIGIPDEILLKPGGLTPHETEVMQRHVEIGARILGGGESEHLAIAHDVALCHHERWDGTGYSRGLRSTEIPVAARITAVADVFDALTHSRTYKDPWPISSAADEIIRQRGRQFDPAVVDAFAVLNHADLAGPPELLMSEPSPPSGAQLQTPLLA
ncbi:MAG TPA: HD domain-containing phosphohydrolase [Solirubrobacteraceae bacterium]|nr:HD domain-containing phosphohydrolase [Solirubrobacteraceae bacterium]